MCASDTTSVAAACRVPLESRKLSYMMRASDATFAASAGVEADYIGWRRGEGAPLIKAALASVDDMIASVPPR